ncbi:hypothetical protein M422DRAFT_273889 [Sphaerobolus stellatus SS14]|uniref:Uncharacterized protein n=1 Tax=Sphaerobolus stellatus (strain SS14) TaxID=990650 RepID=A0A0C9TTH8_SPHS4|nr:hypothetical protein M422DRAFT_273889 [Sphaerobolus stellatus SS14]
MAVSEQQDLDRMKTRWLARNSRWLDPDEDVSMSSVLWVYFKEAWRWAVTQCEYHWQGYPNTLSLDWERFSVDPKAFILPAVFPKTFIPKAPLEMLSADVEAWYSQLYRLQTRRIEEEDTHILFHKPKSIVTSLKQLPLMESSPDVVNAVMTGISPIIGHTVSSNTTPLPAPATSLVPVPLVTQQTLLIRSPARLLTPFPRLAGNPPLSPLSLISFFVSDSEFRITLGPTVSKKSISEQMDNIGDTVEVEPEKNPTRKNKRKAMETEVVTEGSPLARCTRSKVSTGPVHIAESMIENQEEVPEPEEKLRPGHPKGSGKKKKKGAK